MAKLTTKTRDKLSSGAFALPGRRYPIEDESHARNALSRVSQNGSSEEKAEVRAKVHKKFPAIGKKKSPRNPSVKTNRASGKPSSVRFTFKRSGK